PLIDQWMYPGAGRPVPTALTVQLTSAVGGVSTHEPFVYGDGQEITGAAGFAAATLNVVQPDQPAVAVCEPPAQSVPSNAVARTETVWLSASAVASVQEAFAPWAT